MTRRTPVLASVPSESLAAGLMPVLGGVPTGGAEPLTAGSDKCSAEGVPTAWNLLGSVLSPMLVIAPTRVAAVNALNVCSERSEGEN